MGSWQEEGRGRVQLCFTACNSLLKSATERRSIRARPIRRRGRRNGDCAWGGCGSAGDRGHGGRSRNGRRGGRGRSASRFGRNDRGWRIRGRARRLGRRRRSRRLRHFLQFRHVLGRSRVRWNDGSGRNHRRPRSGAGNGRRRAAIARGLVVVRLQLVQQVRAARSAAGVACGRRGATAGRLGLGGEVRLELVQKARLFAASAGRGRRSTVRTARSRSGGQGTFAPTAEGDGGRHQQQSGVHVWIPPWGE